MESEKLGVGRQGPHLTLKKSLPAASGLGNQTRHGKAGGRAVPLEEVQEVLACLKSVPMQVFSLDILVWPRKLERELQLDGGAHHWKTQSPGVYIRRETNIALD